MKDTERLIQALLQFTADQLKEFLENEITKSILQPEEEATPSQEGVA